MDDRQLTLIVVPHGDLETRSFVVSYRKLKIIIVASIIAAVFVAVIVASWFPVALTAAKVPVLKHDLEKLESERAQVDKLAKDLADVEAQYEKVRDLLGADAPVAGSPPSLPPLRPDSNSTKDEPLSPLSQAGEVKTWPLAVRGFLTQTVGSGRKSHPGIDIATAVNTPVLAAGAGTVVTASTDEVYGKYIIIDHGAGLQTVYGHINKALVEQGDAVKPGQKIALSGSTGRSTASHLHFEVRRDRQFLDPLRFVRQPN
jgi:murein DD-endopeptidase MepM/ murein hydrolase activator NlpD